MRISYRLTRFISWAMLTVVVLLSGCATTRIIKGPLPEEAREAEDALIFKRKDAPVPGKMEAAEGRLRVGEKLTYAIQWMGMNVGTATLEIKGIADIDGHKTYHIFFSAQSNKVLSKIYGVRDYIHSFVDIERLVPLRLENYRREGRHRKEEVVIYDQDTHTARRESLLSGKVEYVEILPKSQDVLSCLYYLRLQNTGVGESVFVPVNARKKNYQLGMKVEKREMLKLSAIGTYRALLTRLAATLGGKPLRKGEIRVWFSDDAQKIPLLVKGRFFRIGAIDGVLVKIE